MNDKLCIDTLRCLTLDQIDKANEYGGLDNITVILIKH